MTPILIATASVAVIGLLIGIMLVNVGDKFAVEVDEKEAAVRECLPGNNCGGCGYAGCDALAAAIAGHEAPVNACPVGGDPVAEKIAHIMGVEAGEHRKMVAYVKCAGDCDATFKKANYVGIQDCSVAVTNGLIDKSCSFGCLGFGNCVKACPFDAIHIENGIARVDRRTCKACGKCVAACPKRIIELRAKGPRGMRVFVSCTNKDKGPVARKACSAACIGCGLCEKTCTHGAITVADNVAYIDFAKCKLCRECEAVCPTGAIHGVGFPKPLDKEAVKKRIADRKARAAEAAKAAVQPEVKKEESNG